MFRLPITEKQLILLRNVKFIINRKTCKVSVISLKVCESQSLVPVNCSVQSHTVTTDGFYNQEVRV